MPAGSAPRWGWHQLDRRWAARLVAGSGVGAGDLVLDIGAGTGALTAALVAAGARVVAVELHQQRAAVLRERFHESPVTVVIADAADLRLPRRPFRVVANPPFGVSTAVLRRLVAPGSRLVRADIVVPLHAAHRWAAGAASGSGRWLPLYHAEVACVLPASAFRPPAPNPTGVLVLRQR